MTAAETYKAALTELRKQSTTTMTPREFNYWINVSQKEYIKTRYDSWQQHGKVSDNLRYVHVITDGRSGSPAPLANIGIATAGLEVFAAPADYSYLLSVSVIMRYKNEPCKKDGTLSDIMEAVEDKDLRIGTKNASFYDRPAPHPRRVYYSLRQQSPTDLRLVFRAGSSIVEKVILSYLRKPATIEINDQGASVSDPDFGDEEMAEIVRRCVLLYTENTEDTRAQSIGSLYATSFEQSPGINTQP